MTRQQGRDGGAETTRRDAKTTDENDARLASPVIGAPVGSAGTNEPVDFDDMGDLDRGADDTTEAEPSTGPGPGYGLAGGPGRVTSRRSGYTGGGESEPVSGELDRGGGAEGAGTDAVGGYGTGAVEAASIIPGRSDALGDRTDEGAGHGTAPAMRVDDTAADTDADVGEDEGYAGAADMDPTAVAGDADGPGPARRGGLADMDIGGETDVNPAAGSGMANPADMGDQG